MLLKKGKMGQGLNGYGQIRSWRQKVSAVFYNYFIERYSGLCLEARSLFCYVAVCGPESGAVNQVSFVLSLHLQWKMLRGRRSFGEKKDLSLRDEELLERSGTAHGRVRDKGQEGRTARPDSVLIRRRRRSNANCLTAPKDAHEKRKNDSSG